MILPRRYRQRLVFRERSPETTERRGTREKALRVSSTFESVLREGKKQKVDKQGVSDLINPDCNDQRRANRHQNEQDVVNVRSTIRPRGSRPFRES